MAAESSSTCRQLKKTCRVPLPREHSHVLPDIPPEIIIQILLRLRVKPLLRFKCVSKSWRSWISQPKFAKTHLSLASANTDYTHHRLLLLGWSPSPGPDIKSCSLNTISNGKSDTAVDLDIPLEVSPRYVNIVDCCNGLVCLALITDEETKVLIWNPSTRKSKRVTNPPHQYYRFSTNVFGYDGSNDDYKVAGFMVRSSYFELMVYSLRTNSWRTIGGFPKCLSPYDPGKHLNGALYWIASKQSKRIIVSLDLANEMYGEVIEPDYGDDGTIFRDTVLLDVMNGCLSLLRACNDYAEVWVMMEQGIRESWTKLAVIPFATLRYVGPYSKPICILENGNVLFSAFDSLVWYNYKACTCRRIQNVLWRLFTVHPYVESLVSLA